MKLCKKYNKLISIKKEKHGKGICNENTYFDIGRLVYQQIP